MDDVLTKTDSGDWIQLGIALEKLSDLTLASAIRSSDSSLTTVEFDGTVRGHTFTFILTRSRPSTVFARLEYPEDHLPPLDEQSLTLLRENQWFNIYQNTFRHTTENYSSWEDLLKSLVATASRFAQAITQANLVYTNAIPLANEAFRNHFSGILTTADS